MDNLEVIIGVLSLQGDFAEHLAVLDSLGIKTRQVREPKDLEGIDGLVLPGGESSTMIKLLDSSGLSKILRESSLPMFGTCAGAILLVDHLQRLDAEVERNAYGRQIHSCYSSVLFNGIDLPVSFIRAPKITRAGKKVEVLAEHEGDPVLVRQGNVLAATFHTETAGDPTVHRYFVESVI